MLTYLIFTGSLLLITSISLYTNTPDSFDNTFELSQAIGPIYIQFDPENCSEFLYKANYNTAFWYENGAGTIYPPESGYSVFSVNNGIINLHTGNYKYPFLKEALPLSKTYLGNFKMPAAQTALENLGNYRKYFSDGVLSTYHFAASRHVELIGDDVDAIGRAFIEWYESWENIKAFELYKSLYFPIDRQHPTGVSLAQIDKYAYPNPSNLLEGDIWEDFLEFNKFSTIDFAASGNKINLFEADPSFGLDIYSEEQAMFRYYDIASGEIGFGSPNDLILNKEFNVISNLIQKKPEEVLPLFSQGIFGFHDPIYFNYVGSRDYEYKCLSHAIEYVY